MQPIAQLLLAPQIISVFEDYVWRYGVTDVLLPYTPRRIEQGLTGAQYGQVVSSCG